MKSYFGYNSREMQLEVLYHIDFLHNYRNIYVLLWCTLNSLFSVYGRRL